MYLSKAEKYKQVTKEKLGLDHMLQSWCFYNKLGK